MAAGFRQSMNQLHTWTGLIVGSLLFAIFWMGTLSVFDREIDRWMAPMTRFAYSEKSVSFEALRATYDAAVAERAPAWTVLLPTERQPVIRVVYRGASRGLVSSYFDPTTGAALPETETLAGTRFLYPFHYHLHLKLWDIGEWLVGLAAMAMLVLCVSGVVIHRKIFIDFFTLRPNKQSLRVIFDVHTLAGVLGMPFYIAITLSGLIYSFAHFYPSGYLAVYPDKQAFAAEATGSYSRPKLKQPGSLASLDAMADEARLRWNGKEPWAIVVRHPGDAAAFVSVFPSFDTRIARYAPVVDFDAATGNVLNARDELRPILTAQRFIGGMHQIQFRHWTLRWLYYGLGLLGCTLIATGLLFWLEFRRKKHEQMGLSGVRIVDALAIGSTIGIIIATLGFFAINRLLPLGTRFLGYDRASLEIWVFFLVWLATFGHAWLRPRWAWAEQCRAISLLAVTAVLLNWITTGDHLARSLMQQRLWAVAGMDLMLLAGAAVAFFAAYRLGHVEERRKVKTPALSGSTSHG